MASNGDDRRAGWQWVERFSSTGFALIFADARTTRELLTEFGVDPYRGRTLTLAAATAEFGPGQASVRVGRTGAWGFAFELFGLHSGDPQVTSRLSKNGHAASVVTTGDGMTQFSYAEDAETVCAFDPAMPSWRRGSRPDFFLDAMAIAGLGPDGATASRQPAVDVLAMMSIQLGIRLDAGTVDAPLLSGKTAR